MNRRLFYLTSLSASLATMLLLWDGIEQLSQPAAVTDAALESADARAPQVPTEHRRAEDQTFLTYPEWFLVYSPREYADLTRESSPSQFPFMEHVGQFWQGYAAVHRATKDHYKFNVDYHLMVGVIGASTTAEYSGRWLYERTIGQASEMFGGHQTQEDRIAADVARNYEQFLNKEAWFSFDYAGALRRVWTEPRGWNWNPLTAVRKLERKYALTSEYALKWAYARVMKSASDSAYGELSGQTLCVLDKSPDLRRKAFDDIQLIQQQDNGNVVVAFPRYQRFTESAIELANANISFQEIAGNQNRILISAIAPKSYDEDVLFSQQVYSLSNRKRIAFVVPVTELSSTLLKLKTKGISVEHVYDY